MAYRLHTEENPEEMTTDEVIDLCVACADEPETVEPGSQRIVTDDPRAMRDRIREIDTTVEALEEERASLVQRLADEGFVLADPAPKEPDEDMSDWRNWRSGDTVRCVSHNFKWSDNVGIGEHHVLVESPDEDADGSLHIYVAGFYMNPVDFEWVSRP
jgi:hypothetical protein